MTTPNPPARIDTSPANVDSGAADRHEALRAKADAIASRARHQLSYCANSGHLTWVKPRRSAYIGKVAGYVHRGGYVVVVLCGKDVLAHRVAWLLQTGDWPKHDIDHINGCRTDNRFENLRDVPRRVNRENMRTAMPGSVSGLLGVRWNARDRLWYAVIQARGVRTTLGYRKDKHEAHELYLEAKRRLHEGCTI